jgi:hypothetical protein
MPIPDNTLPMMSGNGPFGPLEMGGMFTTVKVRRDQKPGDFSNPDWYKHPPGTVAYEFTGNLPPATRATLAPDNREIEVQIRKPAAGHAGH